MKVIESEAGNYECCNGECNCSGSKCMAWVPSTKEEYDNQHDEFVPVPAGHCGLVKHS